MAAWVIRILSSSSIYHHLLESFRFEDENEYEHEIQLIVFARVLKKKKPQKASF